MAPEEKTAACMRMFCGEWFQCNVDTKLLLVTPQVVSAHF